MMPRFPFCGARTQFTAWVATWALHFSSDIFIFALPLFFLRNLQLNWRKRIGLYITFGFGVISISACLLRFLIVMVTYPNVSTTNIELWSAIDAYVGVMVACLPSLRPYLNLSHVVPRHSRSNDDSREWHVLDRPPGLASWPTIQLEIFCAERHKGVWCSDFSDFTSSNIFTWSL